MMKATIEFQEKTTPKLAILGRQERNEAWSAILENSDRYSIRNYEVLDELIYDDIDGVIITTPSELHTRQAIRLLENGKAVFCENPLGRNLAETKAVVNQAQRSDRLLGIDYAYRYTTGIQEIKKILDEEKLGKVYAVEAIYHKATGPEKNWFYDPKLSGGGCLMEVGSHMVDLILYLFNAPSTEVRYANLLSSGKSIANHWETVEDFAEAQLCTSSGISVRLSCSWKLSIGKSADISLKIYGTEGGAAFYNIDGSANDFKAEVYSLNFKETLVGHTEEWRDAAFIKWTEKLATNNKYSSSNR